MKMSGVSLRNSKNVLRGQQIQILFYVFNSEKESQVMVQTAEFQQPSYFD